MYIGYHMIHYLFFSNFLWNVFQLFKSIKPTSLVRPLNWYLPSTSVPCAQGTWKYKNQPIVKGKTKPKTAILFVSISS